MDCLAKHIADSTSMVETISAEMFKFHLYCNKWRTAPFGMEYNGRRYTYSQYTDLVRKKREEFAARIAKKIIVELSE